ncbi:MAG: hypothetical protein ABL977_04450 [Candidatus Eisenbacteria bacterium]
MKSLRLLALALLATASFGTAAQACDATKSAANANNPHGQNTAITAAASKGRVPSVPASGGCSAEAITYKTASSSPKAAMGQCTAEMAAQCTPAMRAACEKNAAVAAAMGCNVKGASAGKMANGASCNAHGTSAATAANSADHCAAMKNSATTASTGDHCANMKSAAAATAASAGMKCSAHMNAVAHDCSACEDWSSCEQDVRSLGAKAQVVGLKNGAMIVYTADRKTDVKALQSVVAKRNEKMVAALSAGSDKKLCDDCKQLRGAMASGKLHREVVNVERGCMTLITSNDRGVVQKIRNMTAPQMAVR